MKCILCRREAEGEGGLCRHHESTRQRLVEKYPLWTKAHGVLNWREYLEKISTLKETGRWVKEVAQYELKRSAEGGESRGW